MCRQQNHHFNKFHFSDMTKTTYHLLTTFCLALCLTGCAQEPDPIVNSEIYEACCGLDQPVEYTFDKAYMFVPNVFTPNGDGINDYFAPSINEYVYEFDAYLIYTPVGDTVIFASVGYDVNNIQNTAWNGLNKDGTPYRGLFKYAITAITPNTSQLMRVEGYACCIVCGPDAAIFQTKPGCFFPVQAGSGGKLNTTASNQESDCFK